MAACSSILAWEIPWSEEPGGLSPWGLKQSDMTEHTPQRMRKAWPAQPVSSFLVRHWWVPSTDCICQGRGGFWWGLPGSLWDQAASEANKKLASLGLPSLATALPEPQLRVGGGGHVQ